MKSTYFIAGLVFVLIVTLPVAAADKEDEGFVSLFDGKTLKGWVPVNVAPGTFFVKDNEIVTTGKPTGFMRTEKQYENFIAEFEWMHVPPKPDAVGNSGFFVWGDPLPAVGSPFTRGIEVQVLVNLEYKNKEGAITATSHGDVFSIWGAKCLPDRPHPNKSERCLPSENRAKGAGEWNHYRIEANNGVIKLAVNGKVVSGVSQGTPRKGYLALESEGSECHFRNLKIKELPSTNPKAEEIANEAKGHVALFNGLDLDGFQDAKTSTWKVAGGMLKATDKKSLLTVKQFAKGELVFDWKAPAQAIDLFTTTLGNVQVTLSQANGGQMAILTGINGNPEAKMTNVKVLKPGAWNRMVLSFDGMNVTVQINGQEFEKVKTDIPTPEGPIQIHPTEGLEIMNLYIREQK